MLRIEEAFLQADENDDGALDRKEFDSDDALEAIAPGASTAAKQIRIKSAAPVTNFFNFEEASVETFAIIEFNVLLAVGVGIYIYRKRGQPQ